PDQALALPRLDAEDAVGKVDAGDLCRLGIVLGHLASPSVESVDPVTHRVWRLAKHYRLCDQERKRCWIVYLTAGHLGQVAAHGCEGPLKVPVLDVLECTLLAPGQMLFARSHPILLRYVSGRRGVQPPALFFDSLHSASTPSLPAAPRRAGTNFA